MKRKSKTTASYDSQIAHEKKVSLQKRLPAVYAHPESIDAWRHDLMRDLVRPIIEYDKRAKWLTIGDGMFGTDANYFEKQGIDVTASSLSDETLKIAKEMGFIQKYKVINAEKIPEKNDSYDYVYCKEAFHHLPRPYIGLYEMIRVANEAVVLIEPQDGRPRFLNIIKKWVKKYWRKDLSTEFEPAGNFIYRVNIPELEKVMKAGNLSCMAYLRFNDFFVSSIAKGSRNGTSKEKFLFLFGMAIQNFLCRIGLMDYGLACIVLFKDTVDENLAEKLIEKGFTVKYLPLNPYL